jgi:anti-anti-sigma regulatory factor
VSKKKPSRPAKAAPIELGARLSIAEAVDLHRMFTERVAQGAAIVIDGGKVEEVDTAILQLLASVWMTGAKQGVECRWQTASEALRRIAKLIGVAELLNLDSVKTVHEHAVI